MISRKFERLEDLMADLTTALDDLATAVTAAAARLAAQPDTQAAADAIETQVAEINKIAAPPPAPEAPAETPPAA